MNRTLLAAGLTLFATAALVTAAADPPALAPQSLLSATQRSESIPATAPQKPPEPFSLLNTLKLPPVWRWGPMTLDVAGKILYIPQFNKTSVLDIATGKELANLSATNSGACAVALVPEIGRGYISNSWQGSVKVFDPKTRATLGTVDLGGKVYDAGPMIYDPASKHILVCKHNGPSLVAFPADIDLNTAKASEPIALDGDPQSLVADGQGMAYIALYGREVEVLDTRSMKLLATWMIDSEGTFPGGLSGISMDTVHSRLFVGCQGGVAILSAVDGHELARLPLKTGVAETAFFDSKAYARGGDGSLTVIGQNKAGAFEVQQTLRNDALQGGVMAIDAATGTLYLSAKDPAEAAATPADKSKKHPGDSAIQVLRKNPDPNPN